MAPKMKKVWFCNECGSKQLKWLGQCPDCLKWSTLQEELQYTEIHPRFEAKQLGLSRPVRLKDVSFVKTPRLLSKIDEFDRLVGGGIVPGSLTLVGGDPGVGKSTLLLQLAFQLASQDFKVLYVTGEESIEQTSMRASRLGIKAEQLFLVNETNFSFIKKHVDDISPHFLIIDSIQVIYKSEITSAPGSVSQVREVTGELMHLAKGLNIATFLIGHVTKSGEIAGPRVLEHLVDTVLYFEGDKHHLYRMIRVVKNRFGPTDEIAVFQMQSGGLKEVANPSQIFLEERMREAIGSVVIPTLEGSRPILVEAQALVTDTVFPTPSRRSAGLDPNRLALLLAVLEKKMGYQLFRFDVFVSIAGGIRVKEPGIDLGLLLAIASSLLGRYVDPDIAVIGEVGLSGEIRSVSRVESRVKEAVQMGFLRCLVPKKSIKGISKELLEKIQVFGVDVVEEAIRHVL